MGHKFEVISFILSPRLGQSAGYLLHQHALTAVYDLPDPDHSCQPPLEALVFPLQPLGLALFLLELYLQPLQLVSQSVVLVLQFLHP